MVEEMQTVAALLQTEDPKEQAQKVAFLSEAVATTPIMLTTTLNMVTGKVEIMVNKALSYEEIYALLDLVRKEVMAKERDAILQNKA